MFTCNDDLNVKEGMYIIHYRNSGARNSLIKDEYFQNKEHDFTNPIHGIISPDSVGYYKHTYCKGIYNNRIRQWVMRISKRHMEIFDSYRSIFGDIIITDKIKKYPYLVLPKERILYKENSKAIHNLPINSRQTSKTEVAIQIRSEYEIHVLRMLGFNLKTFTLRTY